MDDLISRKVLISHIENQSREWGEDYDAQQILGDIEDMQPQEPKKCKDCKWWRDSDGYYRRGVFTESKCPINRKEVFEGNGYCYMFEPQERSNKSCSNCKYWLLDENNENRKCKYCFEMDEWVAESEEV